MTISSEKVSGVKHWISQKVSAIALMPFTIWFIIQIPNIFSMKHSDRTVWFSSDINLVLLVIFFCLASLHMKLGLTVVIEDYIHSNSTRNLLLKALVFLTAIQVITVCTILFLLRYKSI